MGKYNINTGTPNGGRSEDVIDTVGTLRKKHFISPSQAL